VLFAVLAAAPLAGCGGGNSAKHDFAGKADEICSDVSRRVAEINKVHPNSVPELTRFIEQIKVTVNDGITRLQALPTPNGSDGVTARKFTDTASREYKQRILPALNQLEQGIVKRDRRAVQAASKKLKQAQVQKQSNQLAAALGATKCAGT
jgi:hypothetical protein